MTKTNSVFLILLSLWAFNAHASLSFLSLEFEALDFKALSKRHVELKGSDSAEVGMLEFFLAEYFFLKESVHEANYFLKLVGQKCSHWESAHFASVKAVDIGVTAYLCAIVATHQLEGAKPWHQLELLKTIERDLHIAQTNPVSESDRFYADGRLYSLLPAHYGQNLKRALVVFHFLSKAAPESSANFWIASLFELEGNQTKSHEMFVELLKKADPRARLRFPDGKVSTPHVDGLGFGIIPTLFFDPSVGLGARIRAFDDRMFDQKRSIAMDSFIATRDAFALKTEVSDAVMFNDYEMTISGGIEIIPEDFFGVGQASSPNDTSLLRLRKFKSKASATRSLSESFFLEVGWQFQSVHVTSFEGTRFQPSTLFNALDSTHTGGFAELRYDTRDSHVLPLTGNLIRLAGYFPTQGLGSPVTFEEFTGEWKSHLRVTKSQWLALQVGTIHLIKDVPLHRLASLSGSFNPPGIRASRFRDLNLLESTIEYRGPLFGPVDWTVFFNAGTVSSEWAHLLQTGWKFGGGSALLIKTSRYRAPVTRLELGYFGEQVLFRAGVVM